MSIEDDFWSALKDIARARGIPLSMLIHEIDQQRHYRNLSSAIRLFVLKFYRSQASADETKRRNSPQTLGAVPPDQIKE